MTKLTHQEIVLLEEETQRLAPGFRMFDLTEFLTVGMAEAQKRLAKKKEVLGDDGETILWPLVVKYVCTDPKRDGYGVPFAWWWIFFEQELLKGIMSDPWGEVKWWLYEELRGQGKTLTMWGCQNSSKTSWCGRFAVVMMAAWTRDANFYVTGPKKSHSEDKGWAEVTSWAAYIRKRPSVFSSVLGLSVEVTKHEVRISNANGTGVASFVSAEDSSTIRGKKSNQHDTSGLIGIMGVIIDEFNENAALSLKSINQNASSNYNYFQVMACNPNPDTTGHPNNRAFSWPKLSTNLDRTRHFRWETAYGLCVRFAWANCPNRILGRTQWPYLLDAVRMNRQREKGNAAIDSEVDAWAFAGAGRTSVLDEAKIKLAGTYNEAVWRGPTRKFIVFDCAFGGQDPATAWVAEVGPAMFKAKNGDVIEKNVISSIDQFTLPVTQDFIVTQDWLDEMEEIHAYTGGDWVGGAEGKPPVGMSLFGNMSMAHLAGKACMEYGIPPGNATFDASQRGDCLDTMKAVLGYKNVKWYYEGSRSIKQEEELTPDWYQFPLSYERQGNSSEQVPKKWSDSCSSSISMLWFLAAESVKAGFLCNGDTCQKGLDELCARPIVKRRGTAEGKRDVLSKDELKKMGMKSPTWAETLALGIYFCIRFMGGIALDMPKAAVTVKAEAPFLFLSAGRRSFSRFR